MRDGSPKVDEPAYYEDNNVTIYLEDMHIDSGVIAELIEYYQKGEE